MCLWLAVAAVSISTSAVLVSAATPTSAAPGGLTALPRFTVGPNLVRNGGFEDVNGVLATAWDTADGWIPDTRVRHSGAVSLRRLGHGSTISQAVTLTRGVYTLSARVKTDSAADGGVRLVLDSRSAGINEWAASEVISGTTDWKLYEVGPVAIATDRTVRVRLETSNASRGTAWFDDVTLTRQIPPPLDVFMLYPNYRGMLFDDQPQALSLDVRVTPPTGAMDHYAVTATLSEEGSGAVIAVQTYPAAATMHAMVQASAMRIGTPYVVEVALVDTARNVVADTYPAFRVFKVSAAMKPAMTLTVDHKSRLLVRGAPRFVLGIYDAAEVAASKRFPERDVRLPTGSGAMGAMNINMYSNSWHGRADATAVKALMTRLQKRGVLYLHTGPCVVATHAVADFSYAHVHDVAQHPAGAGYHTIDECSGPAPHAFAHYQRLKQLDGDGIALAALAGGPAQIALWRETADVLATAAYPMYGPEPTAGYRHAAVADAAIAAREAVRSARPFMTVLPAGPLDAAGRAPTLREMRSHAYMAIVEGARGLWWSGLGASATALPSVVNELAALDPVLVADDMPAALTSNSERAAIRTKVKVVDGTGYLLAYNATSAPVTAAFGWSMAATRAIVHAEDRAIAISAGRFSDTFEPYEAHVYVISSPRITEGN
jgi:hypothetical protein